MIHTYCKCKLKASSPRVEYNKTIPHVDKQILILSYNATKVNNLSEATTTELLACALGWTEIVRPPGGGEVKAAGPAVETKT